MSRDIDKYIVGIDNITYLIEDNKLDKAFKSFLKISRDSRIYNQFLIPLNTEYHQYKDDKLGGKDVTGRLADISQRLGEILSDFKNNLLIEYSEVASTAFGGDYIYKLLCNLNFEHEVDYFNALTRSDKSFILFLIRRKQNYGQRWLFHRLINSYAEKYPIYEPVVLDLHELRPDLNDFLDHLAKEIGIEEYDRNQKMKLRKVKLKKAICKRLETKSQFIVLKDAYAFIHSDNFNDFFKILQYLSDEVEGWGVKHKCIFFFVENTDESYLHSEYCMLSTTHNTFMARFTEDVRFIDLYNEYSITVKDVCKWLECANDNILHCFNDYMTEEYEIRHEKIQQLLIDCDNGNPRKVIISICKIIGKNFEEYEHIWLKY